MQGYVNCVCILLVTFAGGSAVSCPLQRGEVVFRVPLRADGDDNWGPQLKVVTAATIRITSLATEHLCIARQGPFLRYISALVVVIYAGVLLCEGVFAGSFRLKFTCRIQVF